MAQALGGDQAAVGDAAREARLLGAEQRAPHRRVDAVGGHQHVRLGALAAREPQLDPVPAVLEAGEAVPDVHPLGGQGAGQRRQQVGAVDLVVREAEGGLERLGERRAQQRAAVVPAALVPGERPDARPRELLGEPEPVQDPRRVRADLDAGADLAQRGRLLVDLDVEAGAEQRQRRGQAADAAADDGDRADSATPVAVHAIALSRARRAPPGGRDGSRTRARAR